MTREGKPSQWLLGTWRSDKAQTISGWGAHPPGSPEFQKIVLRDLGKLEVRFTAKQYFTLFEGLATRTRYEVVWQSASEAVVIYGPQDGQTVLHLRFEDPETYWVHAGRFREYFAKVA